MLYFAVKHKKGDPSPLAKTEVATMAESVVLVGRKPVMNYVVAALTFFNAGAKEITIKARGRAISKAVDTVELMRRAFIKDLQVRDIRIGTERLQAADGRTVNVSTIEIDVAMPE